MYHYIVVSTRSNRRRVMELETKRYSGRELITKMRNNNNILVPIATKIGLHIIIAIRQIDSVLFESLHHKIKSLLHRIIFYTVQHHNIVVFFFFCLNY